MAERISPDGEVRSTLASAGPPVQSGQSCYDQITPCPQSDLLQLLSGSRREFLRRNMVCYKISSSVNVLISFAWVTPSGPTNHFHCWGAERENTSESCSTPLAFGAIWKDWLRGELHRFLTLGSLQSTMKDIKRTCETAWQTSSTAHVFLSEHLV